MPNFSALRSLICSIVLVLGGLLVLLVMAAPLSAATSKLHGRVQTGDTAIAFAKVVLYRSRNDHAKPPLILGSATSDEDGFFEITYAAPPSDNAVLYLISRGGTPQTSVQGTPKPQKPIRLMTVAGTAPSPVQVVINERTTIASAYALAQFIIRRTAAGPVPGIQNASGTFNNLVNPHTGQIGDVLGNPPNGLDTSTMATFNSLANIIAICVNDTTQCPQLFALATPPGGKAPRNRLQAALNIAHYPGQNALGLFDYSRSVSPVPYHPVRVSAPDAWTLAIKYVGNGQEFDGPGNMAVDKDGNLWITNNYVFNSDHSQPTCGGKQVLKLTPTGQDAPGAPYSGGGVDGAGFGITMDPTGNAWVANFGFKGEGCQHPPAANSVSKFNSAGVPQSPPEGYTNGPISQPQGIVSDQLGTIWIANCGNNTITQYIRASHQSTQVFDHVKLKRPFDIAIDVDGNAWISSSGNNSVVALRSDGVPLPGSPYKGGGLDSPLGLAIDSLGNVWLANSGLTVPCPHSAPPAGGGGVTQLEPNGDPADGSPYLGGGLTIPWDIAVDGNDNIWVSNFGGRRLTQLCGARPENCPPGHETGDPISPPSGYVSDALVRNTGIVIDSSGNVWLANNWLEAPVQTNPGGDGMVVFIGAAAPVKTPLIGPPQQP